VAAWLGTIDPDALPPEDDLVGTSYPGSSTVLQHTLQPERDSIGASRTQDTSADPTASILNGEQVLVTTPNPRFSGFMPIGTQSRETKHVNINSPVHQSSVNHAMSPRLASTPIKSVQHDPNVKNHVDAKDIIPATSQLQRVHSSDDDRFKSHPGTSGRAGKATFKLFKAMAPVPLRERRPAKVNVQPPPSLSPPVKRSDDPSIKYGANSARGGCGGKVTAIAAFWASATANEPPRAAVPNIVKKPSVAATSSRKQTPQTKPVSVQHSGKPIAPPKPQTALPPKHLIPREATKGPPSVTGSEASPKLLGLARKSNALAKSPSVPAIVSSSLATPMLSSTASLARPPVQQPRRPTVMPIINYMTPIEVPSRSISWSPQGQIHAGLGLRQGSTPRPHQEVPRTCLLAPKPHLYHWTVSTTSIIASVPGFMFTSCHDPDYSREFTVFVKYASR
jgi:hypothetical protein